MGGGTIPKDKKKKDSGDKNKITNEDIRKELNKINFTIKKFIAILLMLTLIVAFSFIFAFFNFTEHGAIIDAGDGIKLDLESVGDNYVKYDVELTLKNTGDKTAKVSISGEAYISEMGTAYGDEATTVLKYKYIELGPGESKDLNLGQLTAFNDWHYFVKVYVSWNGGSLELAKILIPGS